MVMDGRLRTEGASASVLDPSASLIGEPVLTRGFGELDWAGMDALAQVLSEQPEGWDRVAAVYEDCESRAWDLHNAAWLRCPYVLAAIGQRLDDAGRCEIARYMIELMLDADQYQDYLFECLSDAIGALGPAVLPEACRVLPEVVPDQGAWYMLQAMLEMAALPEATTGQQAVAIESAEALLRRGLGDEDTDVEVNDCHFAAYALGLLNHTPSIGLIERAHRAYRSGLFANEYEAPLRALRRGNPEPEPGSKDEPLHICSRYTTPLPELAQMQWRSWMNTLEREEEKRQKKFEQTVALMRGDLPAPLERQAELVPPPTFRKVSRNAKCPCGSGRKYKNCCAD